MAISQTVVECLVGLRPRVERCTRAETGWPLAGWLALWVTKVALLLLLISRRVLPFVLRRLSRHARVRSVSFRSVKGLYVRAGPFTFQAERIGYSYNPNNPHPFSIKLSAPRLRVFSNAPDPPPKQASSSLFRRRLVVVGRMLSGLGIVHAAYLSVSWWIRPTFHLLIVTFGRMFIWFIAALTQRVHFEVDKVSVDLISQDTLRISLSDLRFAVKLILSPSQTHPVTPTSNVRSTNSTARIVSHWGTNFGTRFKHSVSRNWDMAWRGTEGSASVSLTVARASVLKITGASPAETTTAAGASLLEITSNSRLTCSFRFNPGDRRPLPKTFRCALALGSIIVDADVLQGTLANLRRPASSTDRAPSTDFAIPEADASSHQLITRLKSVMIANRFRRALKISVTRRRERIKNWMACLDQIEVSFEGVAVHWSAETSEPRMGPIRLNFEAKRLLLACCRSTPTSSTLHRQWLGSDSGEPRVVGDIPLFLSVRVTAIVLQLGDTKEEDNTASLLELDSMMLSCLSSNWPNHQTSIHDPDISNPNDSLIVGVVELGKVSAKMDISVLEKVLPLKSGSRKSNIPKPAMHSSPPAIHVGAHLQEFTITVCGTSNDGAGGVLQLKNGGAHFQGDVQYLPLPKKTSRTSDGYRESMMMEVELRAQISPTFIWTFTSPSIHDARSEANRPDPVVSLAAVDIISHGSAITLTDLARTDSSILDTQSWLWDMRVLCDDFALDLWNSDSVEGLRQVIRAAGGVRMSPKASALLQSQKSRSPAITCFFSVANITVCVTGHDPSPSGSLGLRKGVFLKTRVSSSFCTISDILPYARIRGIASYSNRRQRLGLAKDMMLELNTSASSGVDSSLCQISVPTFQVRRAISTDYDADVGRVDNIGELSKRMAPDAMILDMTGTLFSTSFNSSAKPCRSNTTDIQRLAFHFKLGTAYFLLIASTTVTSLLNAAEKSPKGLQPSQSPRRLQNTMVRLFKLEILWTLPLGSRICLAASNLVGGLTDQGSVTIAVPQLCALVPSSIAKDRWERLGLLKGLQLKYQIGKTPLTFEAAISLFKLRIPWRYILADLIQDIVLAQKGLKHLARVSILGRLFDVDTPGVEEAKIVPRVFLTVDLLSLEACDDPFESALSLIFRTGTVAQAIRNQREAAFAEKVAAIQPKGQANHSDEYSFTADHSVSVDEAWFRLQSVHSASWILAIKEAQESQTNSRKKQTLPWIGSPSPTYFKHVVVAESDYGRPPLFGIETEGVALTLQPPSFGHSGVAQFIHERGSTPISTLYNLLIPFHLSLRLDALSVSIRDYPLPLISIPAQPGASGTVALESDLVIAEELGPITSVLWAECQVTGSETLLPNEPKWSLNIPKTAMPVKIFAKPSMAVDSNQASIAWGVSYTPAIQSISKVIESLTHPPKDTSPALGFWDKMRLVLHCELSVKFIRGVDVYLKGSRDPYELDASGAGFSLCWRGTPTLAVGGNSELFQLSSEEMLIAIPEFDARRSKQPSYSAPVPISRRARPHKVVAHLRNGIMMGLGFAFERACRTGCSICRSEESPGDCRIFLFKPHYQVQLRASGAIGPDSYDGFRSDYIHFSVSLTSPYGTHSSEGKHSSVHLSALTFAHFWDWWALFNSSLSPPVGQGKLYHDARPPSPKFGKHLATIKYRISVAPLFIAHVYNHDTVESWRSGETHMVGIKLAVSHFQADMHQRDEEAITTNLSGDKTIAHHKAFHSAEVVILGLDLRSMYAVFSDPEKLDIQLPKEALGITEKTWGDAHLLDKSLEWYSDDDWVELSAIPPSEGSVYWAEVARCPKFTYFKPLRSAQTHMQDVPAEANVSFKSRFEGEETHDCVIGKEPSITQYQTALSQQRLDELKKLSQQLSAARPLDDERIKSLNRQMQHLASYIQHLGALEESDNSNLKSGGDYVMPSEEVSSLDWQEFFNVYQIHSPSIHLTNVTRNMMIQYYYASRSRRGFEYHMSNRAVKFIVDQAEGLFAEPQDQSKKTWNPASGAHAAAHVLRKILIRDDRSREESGNDILQGANPAVARWDPSLGWNQTEIFTRKGHFCLLIKPQIVLQSEKSSDSTVVLASSNMSLQAHTIIDRANAGDPINGPIMTRTYASLRGLQVFSPSPSTSHHNWDHQCVPLEVLVDYRCESTDFDRLVPQTDATLQYDKFNRLRLRNNVRSVGFNDAEGTRQLVEHLHYHTDLIAINVPRLAVLASSSHFSSISHVVTDLLLYSDPIFQRRSEELETYLILYDFRELKEAANLVIAYQRRIRDLLTAIDQIEASPGGQSGLTLTELRAQVFVASEDLDVVFEAIKLAQEKAQGHRHDQKLAVRLLATSSEITWQMIDDRSDLLAKLSVKDVGFSWLSRQDSSTVNKLVIRDLQAFDGSSGAIWPEILSKHKEPASHPLVKRGIFAESDWCVLPAVGGITVYESFKLDLHPIRLQIQTSIGTRIMDYVWPARQSRRDAIPTREDALGEVPLAVPPEQDATLLNTTSEASSGPYSNAGGSRSFGDLTTTLKEPRVTLKRSRSFLSPASERGFVSTRTDPPVNSSPQPNSGWLAQFGLPKRDNDAIVMRGRSSQKTFVLVQISSLNLLLSIMKEDAFLCREARIKTRELVYRNQTWSFEELAHQFIPSDPTWKGWVKMALQQPLLPVLPVAKELLSKTKWGTKALLQTPLSWPPTESNRITNGEETP